MKYFANKGKLCSIPFCKRKARSKGMCNAHYIKSKKEIKK
jgi:hypothetical protein